MNAVVFPEKVKHEPTARAVWPASHFVCALLVAGFLLLFPCALSATPPLDAMMQMPLPEREAMADEYYAEGEYKKAFDQYHILARLGRKEAQFQLAKMYFIGAGVTQDRIDAWVWASLSAEFNHPEHAAERDRIWEDLSLDEREQAVAELQKMLPRYSDSAVAWHIMLAARRKMRMQTVAHGLRTDGTVQYQRPDGIKGDPNELANRVNMIQNVHYLSKLHHEGGTVTLGAFEVLEDEPDSPAEPAEDTPLEPVEAKGAGEPAETGDGSSGF